MKKTMVVLTMAMVVAASGCGSNTGTETTAAETTAAETTTAAAAEDTTAESSDTASKGTFTVGFDADLPPMGFKGEDGSYVGFDLDLAQEVAKRLGLEYVAQPILWDAKDMELDNGTIDCVWNGFTITGREDKYTWTEPYMDNSQVFIVMNDSGI